jgi:alkanesulfonate monooxygenase SsuD/methylene tetrahydromethanopterin reductase-like flavin-dependent oxidoreductase (luciferase family)
VLLMRFDMRAPAQGAPIRELYAAALEMCAWGEARGLATVAISEHHGSPDGYLPAPLLLASAIAARTRALPIQIAALVVPLHDPIELAEQMAVLDVLSGGRVSYVCAIGYRDEEYAMFGRDARTRGRRLEACLSAMRRAWSGEAFEFEGRPVRVTPRPLTPGGPALWMGGSSAAAARRAARLGMHLLTQGGDPALPELYARACREAGREPGLCIHPPPGTVTAAFVAEDPDEAWQSIGPCLLHDARSYAAWLGEDFAVSRSKARSVAELRAEQGAYRIFTPEEAIAHVRAHGVLVTHPLCGGLAPERAWRSLELIAERVLPAVRGEP